MRTTIILACMLLISYAGFSQSLKMTVSNPQPRVGQTFEISIDLSDLKATMFKPITDQFEVVEQPNYSISMFDQFSQSFKATKAGSYTIAPIVFEYNDKKYFTEPLTINVIEALPDVDEGVWVRKVEKDDHSFYLIVEQRTPAEMEVNKSKGDKTNSMSTDSDDKVHFTPDDNSISAPGSNSKSDLAYFTDSETGEKVQYISTVSIYTVEYKSETGTATIDKNDFTNLPKGFKMDDIVVKW